MPDDKSQRQSGELDSSFLTSANGILKFIEMVVGLAQICMLSWVAIVNYQPEPTRTNQARELEVLYRDYVLFSLGVTVIVWLLTTIMYFMYACSLPKKPGEELPDWCYGGNVFKAMDILIIFNSMALYLVVVIVLSISSAVEPWTQSWQTVPGLLVSLIMASTQLTVYIINLIMVVLMR